LKGINFMKCVSILFASTRLRFYLPVILMLSVLHPSSNAQTPPPIPAAFQDLYTELDNYLDSFNTTLGSPSTYPVLYTGTLTTANGNAGSKVLGSDYLTGVQLELQGLKAMGFQAIMIELPFPVLYQPFYTSLGDEAEYQQFVSFYTQVASMIRAEGMKLVIENDSLFATGIWNNWNVAPFYATLDWTEYQQARAQTAIEVAQVMQPDYLVLMEEPDTESQNSGQSNVNTVSGATDMVSLMLTSLKQAGITGIQLGAGMGSWYPQYLALTQSLAALPLNFIDMHVYLINDGYLNDAVTIASTAAAAGKPVTMTECWLYKVLDSELDVLDYNTIWPRNTFTFWEPLDTDFLSTMQKLGNYSHMHFLAPFYSYYFRANLPYDLSTEAMSSSQIMTLEGQQATTAMEQAAFTSTGVDFYKSIVSPADTIAPTAPTNLTGFSKATTTTTLSWSASTDNVGVAGYYVYRNGVYIGTTAETFYQDSGLITATTYSYAVYAFDLGGNKSHAETVEVTTMDVTPPSTPAHLATTVVSGQQINLAWSPSTDLEAVAGYYVFRGTTAAGLSQVGLASPTTSPSFVSYPLTPGTTYYFGVEAVDTSGNVSAMSAVVSAATLAPPTAPTKLAATPDSTTMIGLTWVAGTSGMPLAEYRIFRGTSTSNLSQVAVNTKTSYTDTGLTPGTKYYYAVQEEDTGGDLSPLSATASATTQAPPAAPNQLVATPVSTQQFGLTWVPGSSGLPIGEYRIFRGASASNLSQVGVNTESSYMDSGLTPGTKYYYAVQEEDTSGDLSPLSAAVSATTLAPPTAPTKLAATPVSTTLIGLTWAAGASGLPLAEYRLFRGTSTSNLSQVAVNTKTSYTDSGLTPGTTYYYAVQEEDTGGDLSPLSAAISATTLAPPAAPKQLVATPDSTTLIGLTWVAGASGLPIGEYRIFRGTSPSNLSQVAVNTKTSFTDTGLTPGTAYYYAVQEEDTSGDLSPLSATVSATTP
jgi:fibronectin type 3 domain-containing protein